MSYVIANTGNPLGRRNLSRYLGRMGWDNIPYPRNPLSSSVARLNGEFNPSGGDPSTNTHGAVTYRIDPRSGQYIFSRTDIKPRGLFMQNTFQHPAPPVITPLGVRALPPGKSVTASTMVHGRHRGRVTRTPGTPVRRRSVLDGLGCNCGGRCGLGVDECSIDSDCGPNAVCGGGMCYSVDPLRTSPSSASDAAAAVAAVAAQVANAVSGQRPAVVQPASWWDQKTSIGGTVVSNPVLAAGAVGFAFLLAGMGGKRR